MTTDDDAEVRSFVARLFGTAEEEPEELEDPKDPKLNGNRAPNEGRYVPPPRDPDAEFRRYVGELFDGYYDG